MAFLAVALYVALREKLKQKIVTIPLALAGVEMRFQGVCLGRSAYGVVVAKGSPDTMKGGGA